MNQERVILFCGHMCDEPFVYSSDDDYGKTMMSWFTMLAPEIRAGPSSSGILSPSSGILSSDSSSSPLRKRKRNTPPTLCPFTVLTLPTTTFFTAVGTSIFIFHNGVNKIITFKNSGNGNGDWKLAPRMKHPRKSPHIIVVDGKLYVIGGLKYPIGLKLPLPAFIEVFDPDIGSWESLPNPNPSFYQPREMVTVLHKNRYILVTSYIDSVFYIYEIPSRIWSPAPPVPNLSRVDFHLARHKIKSVNVDDMLYRISFDHVGCYTKHLVIQAFKLSLDQWFEGESDQWFEGCLNVESEIFGECNEILLDEYPCCGLIHLADQKFCLLLQSSYIEDGNGNGDFDRRRSAFFKRRSASSSYLYSVVLEISPILDKPMDVEGFMGLKIVVLSTEKYRLIRPLVIQDAMLVDITFHPSNMLALRDIHRCNESLLKEFGMAQPSKEERDELLRQHDELLKQHAAC